MTTVTKDQKKAGRKPRILDVDEHTVEIVSDPGEGAQKCGQIFGSVSAKMGNGAWTVELIPAEIQPPPRIPAGASGNRIRIGRGHISNWGDTTDLAVCFNEQVLLNRHRVDALADNAVVLLESMWKEHPSEDIRKQWKAAMKEISSKNYRVIEIPMDEICRTVVEDPRKGKNMFALGILSWIYDRDLQLVDDQIAFAFRGKSEAVYEKNIKLLNLGYEWAAEHLDFRVDITPEPPEVPMVVMNGNEAIALGGVAAGMDLAAMYPITPATSVSHQLGEMYERFGGVLHQAEDEIAAAGVAIGASYAGKVAWTITSGPGMALKTEFLGLAIMTETPLVVVDVQRGGPSTGLPTKVEQGDLLAAMFGQPGDAPHVVMAPATIEECFHAMVTARRIAETFRTVVMVLSDANLATGVQPFPKPDPQTSWIAGPFDQSAIPDGLRPYDWDPKTGLSRRFIPGQPNGMHTVTGLAHDENSKVAYAAEINQRGCAMRSRKLAVLQQALKTPEVYGDADGGDLLVVGWGSTMGAIEEAVDRARKEGLSVSSLHLRFLSPMEPGLQEIFEKFDRVMTVEINYSDDADDPYITEENRRYGQLAWLLRARTLIDIDSWTRVIGEPLRPRVIYDAMVDRLVRDGKIGSNGRTRPSKGGAA
ncbi:MAG: 2-oxoacid:acceptor oxidoreductase subunit alpha [Longimicrobiales bacterium]|nr:2-oxoacid:acceptor oxidoreductase subunit alpha [Longimicrobiales bacterium]